MANGVNAAIGAVEEKVRLPDLDWETSAAWLVKDARDDFFPDVLGYVDIAARAKDYVSANRRKLLQYSLEAFIPLEVPKSPLLARQVVWLPAPFRLVHLALLDELYPLLTSRMHSACYSYRLPVLEKQETRPYPFPESSEDWQRFTNDYRRALGGAAPRWAIATDLTAFFEHIAVDQLVSRLANLITSDLQVRAAPSLELLSRSLAWCSTHGVGIPQNCDASSFFCSAMMTEIDRRMSQIEGVTYFRYVDDIRLVADSRGEVVDALQELQRALRVSGLFLNSAKTQIYEPDTQSWLEQMTAEQDQRLAEVEAAAHRGIESELRANLPHLIEGLSVSVAKNDDRKVRAYGNRLRLFAQFDDLRGECLGPLVELGLRGLRDNPSKADTWARFAREQADEAQIELVRFARDQDYNRHPWACMWAIIAAGNCRTPAGPFFDLLRSVAYETNGHPFQRAWAVMLLGKHGDNVERQRIAADILSSGAPTPVLRSALVAIQELPNREEHFAHASRLGPVVQNLVAYLRCLSKPNYGKKDDIRKKFQKRGQRTASPVRVGFGLVGGQPTRFNLAGAAERDDEPTDLGGGYGT